MLPLSDLQWHCKTPEVKPSAFIHAGDTPGCVRHQPNGFTAISINPKHYEVSSTVKLYIYDIEAFFVHKTRLSSPVMPTEETLARCG